MITITSEIKSIGYDGDIIRTFTFSAVVTHSDYPGVSTGFGGEPLVNLPRGTDLQEYVQMQFTHDQAFVAHMTNTLEFEYIKAGLTVESVPLSPEEQRAQMPPLTPRQFRDTLIDADIMPDDVTAAIDQIPDEKQRAKALNAWEYPTQFTRTDPLVDQIGAMFGLSPEDIDALWVET